MTIIFNQATLVNLATDIERFILMFVKEANAVAPIELINSSNIFQISSKINTLNSLPISIYLIAFSISFLVFLS